MKNLNRKEFLKLGTALPISLGPLGLTAASNKKETPKRIIFINNSLGFYEPYFFPKKQGDITSSNYLKNFRVKNKLTVFQNLFHPGMETSNHDSEKSFLTGTPNPESTNFVNGISLDQILAKKMGEHTRFPFLNFNIYDRGWGCSWNGQGSAIPPMHDEGKIFEMLFEEEDLKTKRKRIAQDLNILSSLRSDLKNLKKRNPFHSKLTHYELIINELESRLERDKFWINTKKPNVKNSLTDDNNFKFSNKIRNLFELAKLAFQTDSTRVITFSMDWIYGAIKVPGTTGGWHTLSHHGGRKDVIEKLSHIEKDTLKHFEQFLFELDQIKEGQGTLLDHTTVIMGSNFGDSSNHTCNNLPIVVAGGGYQHKNHKVLDGPTPLCNLYLELLHKNNIDIGQFGSSEKNMNLLTV